jgi:hypothetical protein
MNETINCKFIEDTPIKCSLTEDILQIKLQRFVETREIIKCVVRDEAPMFFQIAEEVVNFKFRCDNVIDKIWELLNIYLIQTDLTNEVDGIKTDFTVVNKFYSNSLKVWLNGIKQRGVIVLSDYSFRVTPAPESDDSLEIEYIKKI